MNIVFQIDGGIGKSVMGTAVIKGLRKRFPKSKIHVITAYPDVFSCNPDVYKTYTHNNLNYFYRDVIEGKKVKLFLQNPYLETPFILQEEHLLETWFTMFGMTYQGEQPEVFLTSRELKYYANQLQNEKPIMVIQTNGGADNQGHKYSWARDMPQETAQKVVDALATDYTIYHIRREDQVALNNTLQASADFRFISALIKLSAKRLFIDSFGQHVSKALGLDSVVCWVANKPEQFGYANNINIVANEFTTTPELKNSVFSKFNISGDFKEFPYKEESEIFDVETIIDALKF